MRESCIEEFPQCDKIKLHVNERNGSAKNLYVKLGFTVQGTKHNYPEQGETSHRMEMAIYDAEDSEDDEDCSDEESSVESIED